MTIGSQAGTATIDQQLTSLSLGMRNLLQQVRDLNTFVNGQGNGLSFLESLGFSSGDASSALTFISYLNTIAGCYFGTVQQGGSGGSGAIDFNFDNALAPLWAGQ